MHRGGSEKPAAESENEKGEHKNEGEGEKEVSCCVCETQYDWILHVRGCVRECTVQECNIQLIVSSHTYNNEFSCIIQLL